MIYAPPARPVDQILVLGAGELCMAMLRALAPLDKGVAPLSVLVRPASLAASDEPKRRALAEIREFCSIGPPQRQSCSNKGTL